MLGRWAKQFAILGIVASATSYAIAQDRIPSWFDVPQNESAIALYLAASGGEIELFVEDGAGRDLERLKWDLSLPLVRQYRIKPGKYFVHFDEMPGAFLVNASPGKISYLVVLDDLSNGFLVAMKGGTFHPKTSTFAKALETIDAKVGYKAIQPIDIAPAKDELYFRLASPPPVKPPPER